MTANILLVDDSSLMRRTARRFLEEAGHTVVEASNGAQALELFFLNPPDIVLLDLVMTGMFGLDVLAKLREINPEVRVLIYTADIQKSTFEDVKAAGAKGLLNKPVNREQLLAAVAKLLEGGALWI